MAKFFPFLVKIKWQVLNRKYVSICIGYYKNNVNILEQQIKNHFFTSLSFHSSCAIVNIWTNQKEIIGNGRFNNKH